MKRRLIWLTAAMLCVAAALYLAFREPARQDVLIGCADAQLLFESTPEYQLLKTVKMSFEMEGDRRRDATSAAFGASFPSRVLSSEIRSLEDGFAARGRNIGSLMSASALDALRRDFISYREVYSTEDARAFEATARRLESLRRQLNRPDPDDPMAKEKFDLFALRLKLKALTRDPYVFSEERLERLETEAESLRVAIDEYERSRLAALQSEYDMAAGAEREEFLSGSRRRETELKERAARMLEEAETALSMVSQAHEADMSSRAGASSAERKKMAAKSQSAVASPAPPSVSAFDSLEKDLEKEFIRGMMRRAPAVADKRGLSVILISRHPLPRGAVDVTGDFLTGAGKIESEGKTSDENENK